MKNFSNQRKHLLCVIVSICLLFTSVSAAQICSEAMAKIDEIALIAQSKGWNYRYFAYGDYLDYGNYYYIKTTFFDGTTYKIVGAGDGTVRDLDIFLYDENGNEVDKDTGTNNLPLVEVRPRWTGTFIIKVVMHGGYGCSRIAVFYD